MSVIQYKAPNTAEAGGPSPVIWADCPVIAFLKDPGKGIHLFEDFIGNIVDLAAAGQFGQLAVVETGDGVACTLDTAAHTNEHGVAKLVPTGSSQYDEAWFVSEVMYHLQMENRKKMWFETRIKLPAVADDMSLLAGLGDATVLAGSSVIQAATTPTTIVNRDFVGFVAFTDGTKIHDIDAIYSEVGDGAVTQVKNAAFAQASWVNDTYVKLGLRFDGVKTLDYFINGVLVGSLDVDDFATVTANELTPLGLIVGCVANDTSAPHLDVDWIRFACEN